MPRLLARRCMAAGSRTCLVPVAVLLSLLPTASVVASSTVKPFQSGDEFQEGDARVPHYNSYHVVEDIEGIDGQVSAEWLDLHAHLPLLKLALPATYMSTLTDVNVPKYAGKVESQNLGVVDQLKDGIRLIDVRLWRDERVADPLTGWFTEVPWRLFEDAELLKSLANRKNLGTLSAAEEEALNVHSRTDLVEGLFKPVLQFLRKSKTEIAVVVFSAVNGNTHTKRNAIAKGSDLADSLAHAEKQLESFLQSGGPYSDNEHDVEPQNPPAAPSVVRVGPHSAYYSPLLDSFVKKSVTFNHFAEITELIDKFWGALLPRHSDAFVGADEQIHPMRDSQKDPEGFRQWQRSQGAAFLAKPVSELRDAKVRLLLLVDDPLLAWFITTQSQHQVMAFVKADHMYDVSYKSESHFAPCASPHTARNGKPSTSRVSSWPVCRSLCNTVGPKECSAWSWKPDESSQSLESVHSRREGDLGSLWDERADEELGKCELFTTPLVELSFEAITQGADCPNEDLMTSELPWDTMSVVGDLLLSVLPLVHVEAPPSVRRHSMRKMTNVKFGFDSRVCMLTTGSPSGHEMKYGISQKLIRVIFAPPTPQIRIEASQRPAYSQRSDVVRRFNSALADYVLLLLSRYRILERDLVVSRPINAIQISKYHSVRSRLEPFAAATFFEHIAILNPSGLIGANLMAFPEGGYGFPWTDPAAETATKAVEPPQSGPYVTMWLCFIGIITAVSVCVFIATLWCPCHLAGFLRKVCRRRATAAGPSAGSGGVVSLSNVNSSGAAA